MSKLRFVNSILPAVTLGAALLIAPALHDAFAQAQRVVVIKKKTAKTTAAKPKQEKEPERASFSAEDEGSAAIPGMTDARVWGDSEAQFAALLPQVQGPWLAISGGGADGAYGGGVLAGWTQSGNRPEFAVVSGASIGALIAPFAFLGPRYDEEIRKNFTTMTAADIFEDRATRDSLFDYWPLKRQVEQRVTAKLLSEIAAEHARGRRLFVATTNLDAGRRVIWNMGAIAARGSEKGLALFRDVLLASCSIPGFFSPVAIEVEANGKRFHEIHGDATLTTPFFVVPEAMLSRTSPPPMNQIYIIVNSKLGPEFKMADRNLPGVLGRSIGVALTAALRSELALLHVAAQRHGMSLSIAHVDPAFDHPSRGPFDGQYMAALYAVGLAAGKNGTAFEEKLPSSSLRGSNTP